MIAPRVLVLKAFDLVLFKSTSLLHALKKVLAFKSDSIDKIVIWRVSGSITQNAKIFDDMAAILCHILSRYTPNILISDFPHPDADITIALNSYSLSAYRGPKPQGLIIYNFEQLSITGSHSEERYLRLLRKHRVMEYSENNKPVLDHLHVNYTIVPPLYHKCLEYEKIGRNSSLEFDVICVGTQDPRRILLKKRLASRGIKTLFSESLYGTQRNMLYQKSRLSIYSFVYETSVMPWLRISFLLANKIPILCEEPPLSDSLEELRPFICFARFDDIPTLTSILLSDSSKLQEMSELGYEYIVSRPIEPFVISSLSHIEAFRKAERVIE